MIDITKYKNIKNKRNLKYPSIPASISPLPRSDDKSTPSPPEQSSYKEERERTCDPNESIFDEDTEKKPHLLNQEDLRYLIRVAAAEIKS
jgi:hypothetical protein